VSEEKGEETRKRSLHFPVHTKLPDGQQDPGLRTAPVVKQNWALPGQSTYIPGVETSLPFDEAIRARV